MSDNNDKNNITGMSLNILLLFKKSLEKTLDTKNDNTLDEAAFFIHVESKLNAIKKEIKKSMLKFEIKSRLLSKLDTMKNPQNKILKKKIDIDLSGYSININTFVQ